MELVLWANNLVRDDEKATVMQRAVVVQGRRRAALRSYRVCGVLVLSQGSVVVCVVRPRPTRRARVLPIDVTAPIDNGSVPPRETARRRYNPCDKIRSPLDHLPAREKRVEMHVLHVQMKS